MIWLAIDTSGITSSVAIMDDDKVLTDLSVLRDGKHSEQLVWHIDEVIQMASITKGQVEAIAVAAGPGSFTGLRIGLGTAKALAFAWKVPVVGVNTLKALLHNYEGMPSPVCALIDAQKECVYYSVGEWNSGQLSCRVDSRIASIRDVLNEITKEGKQTVLVGEATALFRDEIGEHPLMYIAPCNQLSVKASIVGRLGQEIYREKGAHDVFSLAPSYLRKSEAEILWEARRCKKS